IEAEPLRTQNTTDGLRRAAGKDEMARSLWREGGGPYEEGLALFGAGLGYRSLGVHQLGIPVHQGGPELMAGAKGHVGKALVQGGMGRSYYYLGALDRALENFEQALQTRQRMGIMDRVAAARLYHGIGWVRIGRKENQLALESFKESLRLWQEAK